MADLKRFEVRPRGEFMFDGKIVYATNPDLAMRKVVGNDNNGSVVILSDDNIDRDWSLISTGGYDILSGGKSSYAEPNPYNLNSTWRLRFATKCETACQNNEKNPSLKFADFDKQLNNYEREQYTEVALIKAEMCQKECEMAETAIMNKQLAKASWILPYARKLLYEAMIQAMNSNAEGATGPNAAEQAVYKANKQYITTIENYLKFRNRRTSVNHNEPSDPVMEGFPNPNFMKRSKITKKKRFEVRPRGEYMLDGKIVYATNHATAMRKVVGSENDGSVVIQLYGDVSVGAWLLIPTKGEPMFFPINDHPYNRSTNHRKNFAKFCQKACMKICVNPRSDFSDFDNQEKEYEKQCLKNRPKFKKNVYIKIAEAMKDSILAEKEAMQRNRVKSDQAILRALDNLYLAKDFAERLNVGGEAQNTTIEKNVEKAMDKLNDVSDKVLQIHLKQKTKGRIASDYHPCMMIE